MTTAPTILGSTLSDSDNGTTDFIPYVDTPSLAKGRTVLSAMFNHFESNHPFSVFLKEKASHLLLTPSGNTNISASYLDSNSFGTHSVSLTDKFNPSTFTTKPGVYVVQNSQGDTYVGSSINANVRWVNHYDNMAELNSKFYIALRSNITDFRFEEVANTTDYRTEFALAYPEQLKVLDMRLINNILRTITQYEARLLEQAIISYIQPALNTNHEVYIQSGWDPNDLLNLGGRPVEVLCTDTGESLYFHSFREASRVTNVDFRTVTKLMNYSGYASYSDTLDCQVSFVDHSEPMNTGSPHARGPEITFSQVDYSVIPGNEVWVYDSDFQLLGQYSSANTAGEAFGVIKKTVLHNINRRFTLGIIAGITLKVLFARNSGVLHSTPNTPIIVLDTVKGLAYYYSSAKQTCQALLYGGKTAALFKNYVDTSVLFGDRYAIISEAEYYSDIVPVKGPMPLLEAKIYRASGKPAKPVVVEDTLANPITAILCQTSGDALIYLGHSSSQATGFLKRYIDTDKLYKGRYKIYSSSNYQGNITTHYVKPKV